MPGLQYTMGAETRPRSLLLIDDDPAIIEETRRSLARLAPAVELRILRRAQAVDVFLDRLAKGVLPRPEGIVVSGPDRALFGILAGLGKSAAVQGVPVWVFSSVPIDDGLLSSASVERLDMPVGQSAIVEILLSIGEPREAIRKALADVEGARREAVQAFDAVRPAKGDAAFSELPRGDGQRIMFVDDEAPIVFAGARMLARLGYTIDIFSNPEKAFALLRREPRSFDLVISDWIMPGMSGLELVRSVRATAPWLPILVTTGYLETLGQAALARNEIQHVIEKPYDATALAYAVARILNRSRSSPLPRAVGCGG